MDELFDLLEQAYRLAVTHRGVNHPLTRELGSIYVRHRGTGGKAQQVLAELVRAVNLQSRGGSAPTSLPVVETEPPTLPVVESAAQVPEGKKPSPQTTQPLPQPASPPPSSANPAAPKVLDLAELKGLTANLIAERYPAADIRATVGVKAKPDTGKTWDDYTPRQQAAFLVKIVKALPKTVTVPPKDRADE